MGKIYFILVLGLIFTLSWKAYERVDASDTHKLKARVAELEAKNKQYEETAIARAQATAADRESLKKALLIALPDKAAQVEAAFNPPKPKAEAKVEQTPAQAPAAEAPAKKEGESK